MTDFDTTWKERIISGAHMLGVTVDEDMAQLLARHATELLTFNRAFNITAITDPDEMAVKHYIDCIAAARHINPEGAVLDIGSGGGFPGIVLKIACPGIRLLMVDASRKRVSFLNHVVRLLSLDNAVAVHDRIEKLAASETYTRQFDCVTSRAFTRLDGFAEAALPFLSGKGSILALKSRNAVDEAGNLPENRFDVTFHNYVLPFGGQERSLVRLIPVRQPSGTN